jgi:hypothetical protein
MISFATEAGNASAATVFIDDTTEGDLMAVAGVSYAGGRVANPKPWDSPYSGPGRRPRPRRSRSRSRTPESSARRSCSRRGEVRGGWRDGPGPGIWTGLGDRVCATNVPFATGDRGETGDGDEPLHPDPDGARGSEFRAGRASKIWPDARHYPLRAG